MEPVILWRDLPAVSIKIFAAVLTIPTLDLVFKTISQFLVADRTIIHHHIQSPSCFMCKYNNHFKRVMLDCSSCTKNNWNMNQDGHGIPWDYTLVLTSIPFRDLQYMIHTFPSWFSNISCIPSNFADFSSYNPYVSCYKICIT